MDTYTFASGTSCLLRTAKGLTKADARLKAAKADLKVTRIVVTKDAKWFELRRVNGSWQSWA